MKQITLKTRTRRGPSVSSLIKNYYDNLGDLARQFVLAEMGTRTAFGIFLQALGKRHGWTLITEQEMKVRGGRRIRPDGTLKDEMNLVRGYWEAKDTLDNLDDEIGKKLKAGYPTTNIIFEDTVTAVLFQHGAEILRVNMQIAEELEELIVQFFAYVEPGIEEFEQAVEEFKERVPDLAEGLTKKIEWSHTTNLAFRRAFADFFELCKTSLNPEITSATVDEMLVQHILTERLIRGIFENPEFVRRNIIAAEVEKVMSALTSQSFDRTSYLKDLDRFYVAIERAARTMSDFTDKQHFLNTIYERFFQGYSVKAADTLGIVYTPQQIVDFMCASVEEVLEKEFGKPIWNPDVYIVDPCTGTGNFVVNLLRRFPKSKLPSVYKDQLFANEIMLLPYYIAALNIEHAYFEQTGAYEAFEGLCFVDTLDLGEHKQGDLGFLTAANSARVERQRNSPITVVIGNPPYNAAQEDENDNNKNRKYPRLDKRIRDTYAHDSAATLKAQLYDPYVRFFRWAVDRLGDRDGIVCFVSNNGFVTKRAFDGMRRHLRSDFTSIYHIDLHGDVRENPKLSGTTHNVFGIQVGVGITVAIKRKGDRVKSLKYWRAPEEWRKEEKLQYLERHSTVGTIEWRDIEPDPQHNWIHLPNADEYETFIPLGSKAAKSAKGKALDTVFKTYSGGVKSNRDAVVYDFDESRLMSRMERFIDNYNSEVARYGRTKAPKTADGFVNYDLLKWDGTLKQHLVDGRFGEYSSNHIRKAIYRPFTKKYLYFDRVFNNSVYLQSRFFPNADAEQENRAIVVTSEPQIDFSALMVNLIPCLHLGGRQGQCFPFYVYSEDGGNRRENITDWTLERFRTHYADDSISKWDLFYYAYGILHHAGYRRRFAENLQRQIPRLPFASEWLPISDAGAQLSKLHVSYEQVEPWPLEWLEEPGIPLSWQVQRMVLSKDRREIRVNEFLTLRGIPTDAFEYRVGNRSALEWVIDQYEVRPDGREPGKDPNSPEEPEYIVRLVEKIIRVSVETVRLISRIEKYCLWPAGDSE
jgi:predicted helicase